MGSMPEVNGLEPKLLITTISYKAKWMPNQTFMRYPNEQWETKGYRTMTWAQFGKAVDKVAHWLDEQLGTASNNDTIAYLGPSDARYAIMLAATVKTMRKLFIPDGRLTKEGVCKLISSTSCTAWFSAEEDDSATKALDIHLTGIRLCALPSLDWCLGQDTEDIKEYPYDETFEDGKFRVIVIIHTSGTTGNPKPVKHTNGLIASYGGYQELSRIHWPRGIVYDSWIGRAALNCCPPQWLGGLHAMIYSPVFTGTSCIVPPIDSVSLLPDVFKKVVKMNAVDGIKCPPHTIVQLYHDPESQAVLKRFHFILYLGAALDQTIGDDLTEYTRLSSIIGSTETGPYADLSYVDKKLWNTHLFTPENKHRMIPVEGADNLFELVLERPENWPTILAMPWWNPQFDGQTSIETKELYSPVKDKDGSTRWLFAARKDDLTKLSWLAKFRAHDIEVRILKHPDVERVIVGGEGRPTPYVLAEPKDNVLERKTVTALQEELYSGVISRSNDAAVSEISIPKETILIAKKGKPFRLTAKQTISRKLVEQDYAAEIDKAYERLAKNAHIR